MTTNDLQPNAATSAATSVATSLAPRAVTAKDVTQNTTTTTASSSSNSTITANDFLTLLVAEMKNQDPTQPTDPNAYIGQMVGVNSLQQLISINQGITTLTTGVTETSSGS